MRAHTRTQALVGVLAVTFAVAFACPAVAQTTTFAADDTPVVSARPFFVVSGENFAAKDTFTAVFGHSRQVLFGGGVQVAFNNGLFVDVTVTRFDKTGQRAFFSGGQTFSLGIPLTVTLTPIEFSAGYRFTHVSERVVPYAGAGYGVYKYKETSDLQGAGEDVDTSHGGFLVVGGAEFRLARWVGVTGDVQYNRVTGIIGQGGVSKEAGESNLGGVAARFRVMIGR